MKRRASRSSLISWASISVPITNSPSQGDQILRLPFTSSNVTNILIFENTHWRKVKHTLEKNQTHKHTLEKSQTHKYTPEKSQTHSGEKSNTQWRKASWSQFSIVSIQFKQSSLFIHRLECHVSQTEPSFHRENLSEIASMMTTD